MYDVIIVCHIDLAFMGSAEPVDISSSFIGHIERGEKKPSLETMSCLTKALGTTMDYLVLGVKNRCNQQECQLYVDLKYKFDAFGDGY